MVLVGLEGMMWCRFGWVVASYVAEGCGMWDVEVLQLYVFLLCSHDSLIHDHVIRPSEEKKVFTMTIYRINL